MWFLTLLTYVSLGIQILFVTLSLAAGLYYLAEIVEEYASLAGRVIRYTILSVGCVNLCLLIFENLPKTLPALNLVSAVLSLNLMRTFPAFQPLSPSFISTSILVLVNHYLAFTHFATNYHPFNEVIAYFVVTQWLVPFALFVSLSANDFALPTTAETTRLLGDKDDVVSNFFSSSRYASKKYNLLSLFTYVKDMFCPQRSKRFN